MLLTLVKNSSTLTAFGDKKDSEMREVGTDSGYRERGRLIAKVIIFLKPMSLFV